MTEKKDEEQIRTLLKQWANATRLDKRDEVLSNHAEDVVIYDVLSPMKYEGAEAYKKSWDEWQPETTELRMFDLHNFTITAADDIAFAYGFIHCGGSLPDGKKFEDWVRATFCLSKQSGKWLIVHQHISKPMT